MWLLLEEAPFKKKKKSASFFKELNYNPYRASRSDRCQPPPPMWPQAERTGGEAASHPAHFCLGRTELTYLQQDTTRFLSYLKTKIFIWRFVEVWVPSKPRVSRSLQISIFFFFCRVSRSFTRCSKGRGAQEVRNGPPKSLWPLTVVTRVYIQFCCCCSLMN